MIEYKLSRDAMSDRTFIQVALENGMMMNAMQQEILARIAQIVAEAYVKEHYAEIVARLDPQAIANLVIAEGASQINETLHKKMPDKVMEVVKREVEVYQRGTLGGL